MTANSMETEKVSKLVLSYSIPAIIGMLVSALYNITDRIWVGQIPGTGNLALSAIGATLPFATVLTACCAFIATGSATTISTYLGKKNDQMAEQTLGNTLLLTLILCGVYTGIGLLFLETFLKWMGVSSTIFSYAVDYQRIIFSGSIFQFFSYTVAHTIRSTGNLKRYSITIALGAILNIVLDPIFIFVLDMGIEGAAYATNLAACISFIVGISYYFTKKSALKLHIQTLRPKGEIVSSVLSIGVVSFIFQLLLGFIGGFSNNVLSHYGAIDYMSGGLNGLEVGSTVIRNGGDLGLGAMAVVMSLASLFLMPVFGIVQGTQPIISYNFGAKKISRVKEAYLFAAVCAVTFCTLGLVLVEVFANPIAGFFTKDIQSIAITIKSMRIFLIGLPFVAFQLISICLLQSMKRVKIALFLTLLRQVILYFPFLYLFPTVFGFWGIWFAGPASDILAALITVYFAFREVRLMNQLLKEAEYE